MSGAARSSAFDDRWLAGVLGGLIAVAVVFHAAAWLAAVLSGGLFSASLSDSMTALATVWSTLKDPALAWTAPAHVEVTPATFWSVQVLALLFVTGTGATVTRRLLAKRSAGQLNVDGYAGFGTGKAVSRLRINAPVPGRLTLGRSGRTLLATEERTSLAVVGPTGCGKTAGFAIPAILEWQGPIIATSVKADLITATLDSRRGRGKVWIYDPTSCSGQSGSTWTPLVEAESWQGAQRVAAWMCEAAQARLDSVSDGDYWYTQARKALAPYLSAAANSERSMIDVVSWIDTQERDAVEVTLRRAASLDEEIDAVLQSDEGRRLRREVRSRLRGRIVAAMREDFLHSSGDFTTYAEQPVSEWPTVFQAQLDERLSENAGAVLRHEVEATLGQDSAMKERMAPLVSAQSLWDKDGRLRDSVFATVQNVLSAYGDPSVAEASMSCEIDFDEWLSGDNTIYVVAASHEQARLRPVLTTLVQQAIRSAYEVALAHGGTLPLPCLVLLDEAGNIAPLRDLPAYASTARSHGISLVTIWQDLAQIRAIYRDRTQTVLNNHRAKLFGTGIADDQTLEYVSRLIGDVPRTERNVSRDPSGQRRSVSEHTSYRRAAPMDVLRRISVNEAVLLYGSELPVHLRMRPWFADKVLQALASGSTVERSNK